MPRLENQLERLLHPVSPEAFFSRYWEREPLLIRGARTKFEDLAFSFDVLQKIGRDPADAQQCKAWQRGSAEVAVDPGSIKRHYNAGRSICLSNVHLRHGPLREHVAAMKALVGLAQQIGVACYVSPSRAGTSLHCDRHEVFILQIEGEKQWSYARAPSVAYPIAGTSPGNPATIDHFLAIHGPNVRLPTRRELVRAILRPGDLLYLPAGAFHATYAPDHSLALTLGCAPRSMASIIGEAIERAFRDHREWRRNPPPCAAAGSTSEIDTLFRDRVAELSRWLSTANVAEFISQWRSRVADFTWEPSPRANDISIDPGTELVRVWPVAAGESRRAGAIEVLSANRVFTVPRRHERLVEALASHVRFTADEIRRGARCRWATARAFVELMLRHGIIEPA
jgi:ribosomal protein L16 Arg81 hydroxylase